ncbi:hypothetical protein ACWDRR_00690 [Kitasatospora sp. NPDC003701]
MGGITEYRVLLSEFKTGELIAEIPAESVSFHSILSRPGSAKVKVPLSARPLEGLDWSLVAPWRALVHIQRGERILWGGPLLTWDVDMDSETMTLDLVGLWEYYRRNIINRGFPGGGQGRDDGGYQAYGVPQTVIARELIQYYADAPRPRDGSGGDYWASNGPGALSFTAPPMDWDDKRRDRSYMWYEWKSVGEAVEQLAAVIDGFDFRIDHDRMADGRVRNLFTFLPQGGTDTTFVLEHGANCNVSRITSDGAAMCTESAVNGSGEGWGQVKSWWNNGELETADGRRIPRLATVETHNSVSRPETLAAQAWRIQAVGAFPLVVPDVQLRPGGEVSVAELRVGHKVRVRARLENWPGVDAEYVVTELDTTVDGSGESTKLALVPVSAFRLVDGLEEGKEEG